jgi:hypothetical protein
MLLQGLMLIEILFVKLMVLLIIYLYILKTKSKVIKIT